jgi:hypothetical protein
MIIQVSVVGMSDDDKAQGLIDCYMSALDAGDDSVAREAKRQLNAIIDRVSCYHCGESADGWTSDGTITCVDCYNIHG